MSRVPVVGGLAYIERVRQLPAVFTATLAIEPGNRYFAHAVAVLVNGAKVGYVAPEIAIPIFDSVKNAREAITCAGRQASPSDHATSGVELLLDCSALPNVAEA